MQRPSSKCTSRTRPEPHGFSRLLLEAGISSIPASRKSTPKPYPRLRAHSGNRPAIRTGASRGSSCIRSGIPALRGGRRKWLRGPFNRWTIDGQRFDENAAPTTLQKGRHYRLVFDNQTGDAHPIHLHRNSFELTAVDGKATSGILKDVVLVKGYKKVEVAVTTAMDGTHALPPATLYGLWV